MTPNPNSILEQLVKDVEAAVHAMYRGEVRQNTVRAKTSQALTMAKAALAECTGMADTSPVASTGAASVDERGVPTPSPMAHAPVVAGAALGWSASDSEAVMRCVLAWLPMGSPQSTAPDTKCMAAGKMMVPSWGERERAREALRRIS